MRGGVYVDPRTNLPIAAADTTAGIAGVNTPNTNQELNAPSGDMVRDWVAQQAYAFQDNDQQEYPQVDITGMTTDLADRVKALTGDTKLDNPTEGIYSFEDFRNALNNVYRVKKQRGEDFTVKTQRDVRRRHKII